MNIEPITGLRKPAYPIVAAVLAVTLLTACDRKTASDGKNQRTHLQPLSGIARRPEPIDVHDRPRRIEYPNYYRNNNADAYVPTSDIRENPE